MKNLLLGSTLAALALFIWGWTFYGLSGIPQHFLNAPSTDIGPMLAAELPASGSYFVPGIADDEDAMALMARGPVATIHFHQGGIDTMDPGLMLKGFIHGWIVCTMIGLLLLYYAGTRSYGIRVAFCLAVGLIGAVMSRLGDVIWWHYPLDWQLCTAFYAVAGITIAGFVLAKFIKA